MASMEENWLKRLAGYMTGLTTRLWMRAISYIFA
jgi:hypothetical protein